MVATTKSVTSLWRITRWNGLYELSYAKYLKNNVILQINRKNVDIMQSLVAPFVAAM